MNLLRSLALGAEQCRAFARFLAELDAQAVGLPLGSDALKAWNRKLNYVMVAATALVVFVVVVREYWV